MVTHKGVFSSQVLQKEADISRQVDKDSTFKRSDVFWRLFLFFKFGIRILLSNKAVVARQTR